jgi:hypothetical protein
MITSGECGKECQYIINPENKLTITGSGEMDDFDIDTQPWKEYKESITEIIIEEGITNIGAYAFVSCRSLESVTIPDGVLNIGEYAFSWCTSLTSVTIPDGVTNIENSTFDYCYSLESVVLGDNVARIGNFAFANCSSLKSIILPEGVMNIGSSAFYGCRLLESIVIPKGVIDIGDCVFADCCSLCSINVAQENENYTSINGLLLTKDGKTLISGISKAVPIPEGVMSIEAYAYKGRSGFSEIDIPSTVTDIGDCAFAECDELQSVEGGEGLKRVGYDAFDGTLFLWGVDSWDELDEYEAYQWGYGLDPVYLGNFIVGRRGSLQEAEHDEYYDDDGNWTWEYNLVIREGTTGMADELFDGLPITSVTIPSSIKRISESAFNSCCNLRSALISEGVANIDDAAFECCSELKSIALPSTVTNIGASAFLCSALESIVIPEGVVSIGAYAFGYCEELKSIVIPSSVQYVGRDIFYECDKLGDITVPQILCEPFESEKYDYYGLYSIGCVSITNLVIHSGVTNIGEGVFSSLGVLRSVTIPDSVTFIGDDAFNSCKELKEITINATLIGKTAFLGCDKLQKVILSD